MTQSFFILKALKMEKTNFLNVGPTFLTTF